MANDAKVGLSSDTAEQLPELASISPALQSWIDNVIVPALVREYLAEVRSEKQLAPSVEPVADCPTTRAATREIA